MEFEKIKIVPQTYKISVFGDEREWFATLTVTESEKIVSLSPISPVSTFASARIMTLVISMMGTYFSEYTLFCGDVIPSALSPIISEIEYKRTDDELHTIVPIYQ